MYFRFTAGIFLAVLISMAGVALEKNTLELRREVSRQYYRADVLAESYERLRLHTQELSAPERVVDMLETRSFDLSKSFPKDDAEVSEPETRVPKNQLLRWQLRMPRLLTREPKDP